MKEEASSIVALVADQRAGSTVPYVVDRILAQGREANNGRVFLPTGANGLPRLHIHHS